MKFPKVPLPWGVGRWNVITGPDHKALAARGAYKVRSGTAKSGGNNVSKKQRREAWENRYALKNARRHEQVRLQLKRRAIKRQRAFAR